MRFGLATILLILGLLLPPALARAETTAGPGSSPYVVVLGTAQDAGHPQAGCAKDCCGQAWGEPRARHRVASLGIVDPASGQRWLIDASPDFPDQLFHLDSLQPSATGQLLDGLFLTHAHMGHYTGLMHLGREAIGAKKVTVHAMPRMAEYLRTSGPWSQLVHLENIVLSPLADQSPIQLNERIAVTPFLVPHRDEFSETVGFLVQGPKKTVAWVPDIDKWERWERPVEDLIRSVDAAFLDGTFYANGEIPRDMSEIPHPFVVESMERLGSLPVKQRARVRFVHLNHTNPALQPDSAATKAIEKAGFVVARLGDRVLLGAD